jgi:murein DD-endopeptidase MepM/ murein hydrolase activator NlpD
MARLFLPLWLLLALPLSANALPEPEAVPGGVALIKLVGDSDRAPRVSYRDHRAMVLRRDGHWTAVVGIPLSAKPGRQRLTVQMADGSTHSQLFTIRKKKYGTEYITLKNKELVTPNARDLRRIAREHRKIGAALTHWTPTPQPGIRFIPPLHGRISGAFGLRRYFNKKPRKPHSGLDIAAPEGTVIRAPAAGTVVEIGDYFFTGNTVFVDHGQGLVTMYCHMSHVDVKTGQHVRQGEALGKVGMTGRATGPHVHWGVSLNDTMVDPMLFLTKPERKQAFWYRRKRDAHRAAAN